MRGGVTAAFLFAALVIAAPPSGARSSRRSSDAESMTVVASPQVAKARHVRLTVTLHYVMQCNYPGAGPLVVTFPSAVKLPRRFAGGAVKLAGKPVDAIVTGRRVTVTIAPPSGVLCGTVMPRTLTLDFTRKAELRNPSRPGSYRFRATHTIHAFATRLTIK